MSQVPASTTFRDMVAAISPTWLQGFVGLRFMYAMAIQFDAIGDAAAYAVRARFPDLAPPDAFPCLANDRQIEQGFAEPQASYATRLTQWLDRLAHMGSPFGLLMAVRGYIAPVLSEVATINVNGVWDSYAKGQQDGPLVPPTHQQNVLQGWNWDSSSWPYLTRRVVGSQTGSTWWRVWIVIWSTGSTAPWTATTHKYDDGVSTWDGGFTYDWSGTVAQANGLRAIAKKWKASNTWIPWILVSFSDGSYQATGAGVQPDGNWGTWSKVVTGANGRPQYVPSRDANTAFLDGVA